MNNDIVFEVQKRINQELAQRGWPQIDTLKETNQGTAKKSGPEFVYAFWEYKTETKEFKTMFFPARLIITVERTTGENGKTSFFGIIVTLRTEIRERCIDTDLLFIDAHVSQEGEILSWEVG